MWTTAGVKQIHDWPGSVRRCVDEPGRQPLPVPPYEELDAGRLRASTLVAARVRAAFAGPAADTMR